MRTHQNEENESKETPLVQTMVDIVQESILETAVPRTGMSLESLDSILRILTLDVLETLGKPDTEREFVLYSTLISQVYLNTLQDIYIKSLQEEMK